MSTETVLTDEHISEVFLKFCDAENAEFSDVARAIEQAVLQSPEIQALRADAGRLDWLADPENIIGNVQLPTECVTNNLGSLRDAIDEAKRLQQLEKKA